MLQGHGNLLGQHRQPRFIFHIYLAGFWHRVDTYKSTQFKKGIFKIYQYFQDVISTPTHPNIL